MKKNELQKLNRKQLLELLLKQTQRADELERRLEETEKKLQERLLKESQAGSIAEAALKVNCVFEAAQAAADQYLENIKRLHDMALEEVKDGDTN
ncbi:MAG: DNA repair protein [Ruminococcaceae bacterium]|nr:DNA repair protein [Oscillospiraceae bacterium]